MLQRLNDGTWLIDYSTISSYQHCRKLFELRHLRNLVPNRPAAALDMGGAFHAGVAAYRLGASPAEIVKAVWERGRNLPFEAAESKRSIENCVDLVERWINHWEEPSRQVYDLATAPPPSAPTVWDEQPDGTCAACGSYRQRHDWVDLDGWRCRPRPLVEVAHRAVLCTDPRTIVYVAKMDAILIHRGTDEIWIDELKTTSRLDSRYMEQVQPNHQGTGYVWAAAEMLGRRVAGWILDAALVAEKTANSRRRPEDWFARSRSERRTHHIEDWLYDTRAIANEIIDRVSSQLDGGYVRWNKSAPVACHQYDGCQMRPICRNSEDPQVIASDYHEEQWDLLAVDNTTRPREEAR